jgi:hypothetical protein
MARRQAVGAALQVWRTAERRLVGATNGERAVLEAEVEHLRDAYQRLSTQHMVEWIAKLHEAEERRSLAVPSTLPFHVAARDEQQIASEIWEAARSSDEDTPETPENKRTTPRPNPPGTS